MCSTITEMADHIVTVLKTFLASEAIEGSLIYDTLLNQLIFGNLFSYVPQSNFYNLKIPEKGLKLLGEVPSVP